MSRIRQMRWLIGIAASVALLLLAAVLLRPLEDSRITARAAQCRNNLKQLTLALWNYEEKYGSFPPVFVADGDGRPIYSWRVLLLPFLGDSRTDKLYERYRFDEPWDGPNNSQMHGELIEAFSCPSDKGTYQSHWTSYLAVNGPGTIWRHDAATTFADITDGVAETLVFVEVANSGIHWLEPCDIPLGTLGGAEATWPPVGKRAEHRVEQFWGHSDWHEYAVVVDGVVLRIERSAAINDIRPLCAMNGREDCTPIFRRHVRPWK